MMSALLSLILFFSVSHASIFWNSQTPLEISHKNLETLNLFAKNLFDPKTDAGKKLIESVDVKIAQILERGLTSGEHPEFLSFEAGNYSIELSSLPSCFLSENSNRILHTKSAVAAAKTQITEAAAFLADFHTETYGQFFSLFQPQFIEICSHDEDQNKNTKIINYEISSRTLTLSIPFSSSWRGGESFKILTHQEIKDQWNAGLIFQSHSLMKLILIQVFNLPSSPSEILFSKYWDLLNPLSHLRSSLRTLLYTYGQVRMGEIREWIQDLRQNPTPEKNELMQLWLKKKIPQASLPPEFQTTTIEEKIHFLEKWKTHYLKTESLDKVSEGMMKSFLGLSQKIKKELDLEVKMEGGLVQMSNLKVIDVNSMMGQNFIQNPEVFKTFTEEAQDEVRTEVENSVKEKITLSNGTVQIFLVDQITIDVALKFAESYLGKALDLFTFNSTMEESPSLLLPASTEETPRGLE